ncbi:Pyridoxamine 5'-phosphate oxidase [Tsukamurella pulmonis]|uniref:Pyridoxamine 5'-phosphate oxidase n=2 Tax=Tsukamurella pulmonis TaxID=47312 RepID=A0A1H1G4P5_9ACTN|nr:Pyridoxamine 5'-phosphate oxidase [Tsukamurella pulmonis]SUP17894.1 pyridoxamine 5'-phosphate oxidase, FMN-binding family [Tsukamurella pulmonis]
MVGRAGGGHTVRMATQYEQITDRLQEFIADQQMYFVGTAAPDGRVNVSPKGLDSLRVLGPRRVVWLNGTGSGNETAAHLLRNPRITLMFCAFEGKPLILRLFGTARAIHEGDPEWADLVALFPPMPGARNVFDTTVDLVQTSCGFGVPLYEYDGQRTLMRSWAENKGDEGIERYHRERNTHSIDGFPTGIPVR